MGVARVGRSVDKWSEDHVELNITVEEPELQRGGKEEKRGGGH